MTRVGFIGLGRMGSRMARRLVRAGLSLSVFDAVDTRTVDGAERVSSAREVAERSEVVFTMVTDGPAVLSLVDSWRAGMLHVDTTTIGVEESKAVAQRCAAMAVRYVSAPVLGSLDAAEAGTLVVLLSGAAEDTQAAQWVLEHLSQRQVYLGSGEEARLVKLITNGLLGSAVASLAEGVALAERAGIDGNALLDILVNGSSASPAVKGSIQRLREGSFEPRLTTALLAKDLRLLSQVAGATGAVVPIAATAQSLFQAAANSGYADLDSSAVIRLLETMDGVVRDGS